MATFEIGEHDYVLDGRPMQIISGALHYFRVHPDLWADRIRKARLMGLNTIETYVAWNFHSPERGQFDTSGQRDLGRFLDLIAAEGLHAIVRPGPYICAEWDNGGLPAWLFAQTGAAVRENEPAYMAAVAEYFAQVLPTVASRQVTRGGPVLMVQVENEYGAYGQDKEYLRALVRLIRAGGIEVPLFTCDQANDTMLERGGLPELHKTATFGSRSAQRLATLRTHQPTGPLMCMEFWDGWFDSWGLEHHVEPVEDTAQELDILLRAGASVNFYMFHGGTNRGFTNGANDKGKYMPITTSYDYDAPLSEHGAATAKFHALRDVIARYAPVPAELPQAPAPAPVHDVLLDQHVPLWDALAHLGVACAWDRLPTTDEMGHWSGLMVYRTEIEPDDGVLVVEDVRDRAVVFLDHEPVGVLSRTEGMKVLALPRRDGQLELVLEDQGRVDYGPRLGEPKGLIGPARTAVRKLTEWEVIPLALEKLSAALTATLRGAPRVDEQGLVVGPAFRRGTISTVAGTDHFLRTDGWTHGLVWFNGVLLGRYSSAGPTRTLHVPGPLVTGQDEVVLLELQGASGACVSFVSGPDLGITEL